MDKKSLAVFLRYLIIGVAGASTFVSLIVADSMFFPYITGKAFAFRALVELMVVMYLILAYIAPEYRPKKSPLTLALLGFVVAVSLATIFSVEPAKSFWSNYERMEGLITTLHVSVFALILGFTLKTRKEWAVLVTTQVVSGLFAAIAGIAQIDGPKRIDGTIGNSTYFSALMLLSSGIAATFALVLKDRGQRYFVLAASAISFFAIFFTGTRGTVLGILGALVVFAGLLVFTYFNKRWLKIATLVAVATVLGVYGLLVINREADFVKSSSFLSRFTDVLNTNPEKQARPTLWRMAFEGWQEKPLFGWGQENYNYVFNKNFDPAIYGHETWFDRTHNVLVEYFVTTGLVGLVSYLVLLFFIFYVLWKLPNDRVSVLAKATLTATLCAYLIHNLFVFDNLLSYMLLFGIIGWLISEWHASKAIVSVGAKQQRTVNEADRSANVYLAIAIVGGIGMFASLYYANYLPMRANQMLLSALRDVNNRSAAEQQIRNPSERESAKATLEKSSYESFKKAYELNTFGGREIAEQMALNAGNIVATTPQFSQGFDALPPLTKMYFNDAMAIMEKEIQISPEDSRPYFLMYVAYSRAGNYVDAQKYLDLAQKYSPTKPLFAVEQISIRLNQGKQKEAFEKAKIAYDLQPKNPTAAQFLMVLALLEKDAVAQAKVEAQHPTIFEDDRILQTILENKLFAIGREKLNATISGYLAKPQFSDEERGRLTNATIYLSALELEAGNGPLAGSIMRKAKEYALGAEPITSSINAFIDEIDNGARSLIRQ